MRGFRLATAALFAVGVLAGAAAAQTPDAPGGPGKHHHGWGARLQQRLGLTDQQAEAIRQVYERDAEARRQLGRTLRQAQSELRRLVLTDADEATRQAKQAEVQELMAQALQQRLSHLKEIAPILTPEQREKLVQLMEHGGRFHHRHGPPRQAS
ncbi:MAG TPA: periplasmic heavy metal sensor [Methylomirabilota bacterium]|nr:periplasmic heavy metal sensor [Methylomirabilota bacterium]